MVLYAYDPGHYPPPQSRNIRFKKMTREQFEQWLDTVDSNHDGYISRKELYAALDTLGLHFKTWKSWRAMKRCDKNHNHAIDLGLERKKLIDYAEKRWHIIVTN
ncbi:Calcium-binding EF-hand [Rhynchospora pubera]|uniref:Calcium-binding EF-hand n=1 Tax=Rhynchospora pubera TaxID=906938 RepID=A0AAV8GE00_9POAL|nr:Calcium-binding EF-hand [Rhynchospora pubera]